MGRGTGGDGLRVRWARDLGIVLIGLVLGLGLAYLPGSALLARRSVLDLPGNALTTPPAALAEPAMPPPRQSGSPRATVEGFLEAEAAGDLVASFGFLSADDRNVFGSPAAWVASHADLLPPVTGFQVEDVVDQEGEAEVVTLVGFRPSLDEVIGLVPARARVTWVVSAEGGGWGLRLEESVMEALYPPPWQAREDVRSWAEARLACRPALEYGAGLIGTPALADGLCGAEGPVEVGGPSPPDDPAAAAPFLAAFGPQFGEWAQVLPLVEPVPMRVVVAPLGDDWIVIGVLEEEA
ncbi:MAG: hypothetical protein ACRDXD_04325 [Acidimicrobiia bacterium]